MGIINLKKQYNNLKSEYFKNFFILFSGNVFAQALPIVSSFVFARIFSPSEFGVFTTFNSVSFVLFAFSILRYDMAILLPKDDGKAVNVLMLSLLIALTFSLLLLIVCFFLPEQVFTNFGFTSLYGYKYLVPINVFLMAIALILRRWNTRKTYFKQISISRVAQTSSTFFVNVIYAVTKVNKEGITIKDVFSDKGSKLLMSKNTTIGEKGLIYGFLIGQLAIVTVLLKQSFKEIKGQLEKVSLRRIKLVARKYSDFPKINLFHAVSDMLGNHILVMLISVFFSDLTLGLYSFTYRMVTAPLSWFSNSFGEVFYQKISACYSNRERFHHIFLATLKVMILVGGPVFVVLFFFAEPIFSFSFGAKWEQAGTYASLATPWFFTDFVATPFTQVAIVLDKQRKNFILSFVRNFSLLLCVLLGKYIYDDFKIGLLVGSLIVSVQNIYLVTWYYRLSKNVKYS